VDSIAFDEADIARYDPDKVGQLIVISSASVYRDAVGRTLDEAAQTGFPQFAGPVTEAQSTVPPGPGTYSTRKVRMEQAAIARFGERATILRPCAIYGAHSRHPREWWFVKRMLDGRKAIPLANSGQSRFQTTNAGLIGDFVAAAIEKKLSGTFNIADATSPTVIEIGAAIARFAGIDVEFVPVTGYPDNAVGRTPWSVPLDFVIDGARARKAGDLARVAYDVEAEDSVRWLMQADPVEWAAAFPQLAAYPWDLFDYAAEDRTLAKL
jgi:nucleoside-diphosphate-sugar epimerase